MPPRRKAEVLVEVSDAPSTSATSSEESPSKKSKEEPQWTTDGTLMYYETPGVVHSSKIAGFDFDGCLANTSLFKKGADAWTILYPNHTPARLKALHAAGYKLVIFTNQAGIGKATKTKAAKIAEVTGRLEGFIKKVGLPFQVFAATSNADGDLFRKPAGGMWTNFVSKFNGGVEVDMATSFFVGDAAGRPKDHSDSDKLFAKAVGLTFHTQDAFFLETPP